MEGRALHDGQGGGPLSGDGPLRDRRARPDVRLTVLRRQLADGERGARDPSSRRPSPLPARHEARPPWSGLSPLPGTGGTRPPSRASRFRRPPSPRGCSCWLRIAESFGAAPMGGQSGWTSSRIRRPGRTGRARERSRAWACRHFSRPGEREPAIPSRATRRRPSPAAVRRGRAALHAARQSPVVPQGRDLRLLGRPAGGGRIAAGDDRARGLPTARRWPAAAWTAAPRSGSPSRCR